MASSRPLVVRVFAVTQWVAAAMLAAITGALIALTWHSRGATTFRGLAVGAVMFGALALVAIIGAAGIWKGLRWAWWLALVGNLAGLSVFIANSIQDGARPGAEELVFIVIFGVLVLLSLLPTVRRYFLQAENKRQAAAV